MIGNKAIGRLSVLTAIIGLALPAVAGGRETTTPKLAPSFVENLGQWDSRAEFYSGLPGMDVWITSDGLVYKVYQDVTPTKGPNGFENKGFRRKSHVFGMEFVGANANPQTKGTDTLPGVYNYIKRTGSASGVRRYKEAGLQDLYPGVDLRVYLDKGSPRFDLVVKPGGDPSVIGTHFTGTENVRVISPTKLGIKTRFGEVEVNGLYAYQEFNGVRKQVRAAFAKRNGVVKFRVGQYDTSRPLVIDPLVYSTLLGAIGDDQGFDVAADNLGYAYTCGSTFAPTFPTSFGAFDEFIQATDCYITKFSTDAVDILWSTFVGGQMDDAATAIAIDAFGNAYITGITKSPDFPVSVLAPQPANGGGDFVPDDFYQGPSDAFIFKLSADGTAMTYSTYLGGNEVGKIAPFPSPRDPQTTDPASVLNPASSECATDIVVDSTGAATVCGFTRANNFPTTIGAIQTAFAGPVGIPGVRDPGWDGFITKINPQGSAWVFSTYMGGRAQDQCSGLALDADDNIYVSGATNSSGLPTTVGVFVTTPGAYDRSIVGRDAFLLKLPVNGATRLYATVIGGNGNDGNFFEGDDGFSWGWYDFLKPNIFDPLAGFFRSFYGYTKVGVDPQGDAFITGNTRSVNFPTTLGAFDRQYNNGTDAFLSRFFRDGTRLVFSTLIGTAGNDWPNALRIDDTGVAYVAGYSQSGGLTMPADPNTSQPDFAGPDFPNDWFDGDGFVLAFNDSGSNVLWGSYIGGAQGEEVFGIDLDPSRSLYLAGRTNSWTGGGDPFPVTPDVFRTFMINDRPAPNVPPKAWSDAFLTKLHIRVPIVMDSIVMDPREVAGSQPSTGTITLNAPASAGGATIFLQTSHPEIVSLPASVVIPEGQTTVTFTADTVPVLETFITTITASYEARNLHTALVVAPYLSALTVSNINVFGGNTITGRVTLFQAAPPGGAEVVLFSGNPTVVTMPDTVVVPEGQSTAVFDIVTRGVTTLTPVQLTAQYLGVARSQVINVLPAQFQSFLFNPTRVSGGEIARARVTLSGSVSTPTTLTITRVSGFSNVSFPTTVIVPANQNFVDFDVQTGFVPANGVVRLRATGPGGFIEGSLGVDHTQLQGIIVSATDVIGGVLITGRVNLTRPAAPSGLIVTLTNSNPVAGTLGSTTVLVPPGSTTSELFTIQTNSVTTTQTMTITASKPGYASKSVIITVREPSLGMNLIISPASVTGGSSVTGILSIAAAVPDDLVFTITSNNSAAIVPATVTIPAGETEVQFNIDTVLVASDRTATITARRGTQSATAQLQILSPNVMSLTLSPNTVRPNQTSTAFLQLDSVAPSGGIKVNISASIPSLVVIPTSVTVPAGRSTATFTVRANAVSRPIAVEIICQIQGKTRRVSAFLFINP